MQTERNAAVTQISRRQAEIEGASGWSALQVPLFDASSSHACPIPDRPICEPCLRELSNPANRRHGYAFTSCAACGPRRSILERGPFVRANSVMASYLLCEACLEEQRTPTSRRFLDEAISCPACGPTLRFLGREGTTIGSSVPLELVAHAIIDQRIVAVRDERRDRIICDATSSAAVRRLRAQRGLFDVPLVVMARDIEEASRFAGIGPKEHSLLTSVERPVVLVSIRTDSPLTGEVAAGNRLVGLLLPYTPLHHLLLKESGRPLVVLPAGVPDAPLREAAPSLLQHAEMVLVADRSRPATDRRHSPASQKESSKAKVVRLGVPVSRVILACGAGSPGAVCLAAGDEALLESDSGPYGEHQTGTRFEEAIEKIQAISARAPEVMVHDLDERLDSTRFALDQVGVAHIAVQQHHALMSACLMENDEAHDALGVVFDFGGLGTDDSIWGGEVFRGGLEGVERIATFRPIVLAGENVSTRQVWRVALAMVDEAWNGEPPLHAIPLFRSMPRRGIDVVRRVLETGPTVSSHAIGLQLEALAAILLARHDTNVPGALLREWEIVEDPAETGRYPMVIRDGVEPWEIDFRPVVLHAVTELIAGVPVAMILARAANSVMAAVVEVLRAHGVDHMPVAITGKLFEGTRLATRLVEALGPGAMVLRPRALTSAPGAIALGQVGVADAILRRSAAPDSVAQRSPALNGH